MTRNIGQPGTLGHPSPSPFPPVSYILAFLTLRMPDMTTKTRATTKDRKPNDDEARFDAWLRDFDARMADLTLRQDALLRKLGIEPAQHPAERENV